MWEVQAPDGKLFWSAEMFRIYGVDPNAFEPTTEKFLNLVYPEDRNAVKEVIELSLTGRPVSQSEFRMVRPNGEIRYVSGSMEIVCNDDAMVLYGTVQDVTKKKIAEQLLRESEERFKYAAKATSDAIWDWDIQGNRVWRSENVKILFGISAEELAGNCDLWANRIHPEDRKRVLQQLGQAISSVEENLHIEYRFQRNDGSYADVLDRGFILRDASGQAVRMVGALVDLSESKRNESEKKAASAQIRKQASLLDKTTDAVIVCNLNNCVTFWNESATRLYGWRSDEAIGKSLGDLIYQDPSDLSKSLRAALDVGSCRCESIERDKTGAKLIVESHWTLVRDEEDGQESIFVIKTDITQRKENERKIQYMAFHDSLTGLPNRVLLSEHVRHALVAGERSHHPGAILLLDLDNFKTLNDTFGHEAGDRLLKHVAVRLTSIVRKSDTVTRLGGDEFVILLDELQADGSANAARLAGLFGERVLSAFKQPFRLANQNDYYVTTSIGITLFAPEDQSIDDILRRADLAMYQAKASGKNTLRFFDPAMRAVVTARVALEADLREAIIKQQFILHFQPQLSCDGQIIGAEALLRWQQPGRGMILPSEFIPLAEDTALILPLGKWVLDAACRLLKSWSNVSELSNLSIAVNVSAVQLRNAKFVDQVLDVLAQTGADPSKLKIELTESLLVENMEDSIAKMLALKNLGISISLDDFGTGYSSLSYLKRLPIDQLKIDRSFIRDLFQSKSDDAIVRTIISLGQNLGLSVIAEGVENEEQREFLHQHGCPAYQGFLFSRPLPVEEFEAFARKINEQGQTRVS